MSNPISEKIKIGTIGELLVQLRLLQYDVQAASPLKDSGNDLIAVKGACFKSIQIKTTSKSEIYINHNGLPENWDILAIVFLQGEDNQIFLDNCVIKLIPRGVYENNEIKKVSINDLQEFDISVQSVILLFHTTP